MNSVHDPSITRQSRWRRALVLAGKCRECKRDREKVGTTSRCLKCMAKRRIAATMSR